MDPSKVSAIQDWPVPKNTKDVQTFLGFANFYRRFVSSYSATTQPLTSLLKKDVVFNWDLACQHSFDYLKESFGASKLLSHPNELKPYVLECDASDFAIGGVLMQLDDQGILQPIAFYSRQMLYDKELLVIVSCFRHWRHFLQGARFTTSVLTDHLNLKYFQSAKQLTRRQAR